MKKNLQNNISKQLGETRDKSGETRDKSGETRDKSGETRDKSGEINQQNALFSQEDIDQNFYEDDISDSEISYDFKERKQMKTIVKKDDYDEDEENINDNVPEKQKSISKKNQTTRQRKEQSIMQSAQMQKQKQPAAQKQQQHAAQNKDTGRIDDFSIAKNLGLVYSKNMEYDLYYTMFSNTQNNIMYLIRIPLNYKKDGVERQLIKIGYTDDLKQRMQDIRASLEYYVKSQRDENEPKELIIQPLFIATVKSLQSEKKLHEILRFYNQFCLDKDQKKALSNVSGFTEIYFFSESLVKTFESYVIGAGYHYVKSQGLIDEMLRMCKQ